MTRPHQCGRKGHMTHILNLNRSLGDLYGEFAEIVGQQDYTSPMVMFRQREEALSFDLDDPEVDREHELFFLEGAMKVTGTALPGAVAFCRHPKSGFYVIDFDWDAVTFYQAHPPSPLVPVPPPLDWALTPNLNGKLPSGMTRLN